MLQQVVTTRPTFTNFACEALDQLRDLVGYVTHSLTTVGLLITNSN